VSDPLRIEAAGETNVGRKRNHNEDNFAILADYGLFVVADGMGGHASGEVASKMAIDTLHEFFRDTAEDPDLTWPYKLDRGKGYEENRLIMGIKLANLRIHEAAVRDAKKKGMGTTFAGIFALTSGVYVAHVGDSRVYRFRSGKLEQLTDDHSLLNEYIKMGRLSPQEIEAFPHKNVIMRALGMKDTVKVDTRFEPAQVDDLLLVCSDGLSGPVSDPQIEAILAEHSEIKAAAAKLIERANENGGPDNVTCVLVRFTQ
jgi:PPM family protein phosphatase